MVEGRGGGARQRVQGGGERGVRARREAPEAARRGDVQRGVRRRDAVEPGASSSFRPPSRPCCVDAWMDMGRWEGESADYVLVLQKEQKEEQRRLEREREERSC